MKTLSLKKITLAGLILFVNTVSAYSQHAYGINHYFTTAAGSTTSGEYLYSLNAAAGGGDNWGIGFRVNSENKMRLWDDVLEIYVKTTIKSDLQIDGTITLAEDVDLTNLDILQGTNDLRFEGSPTSGTSMKITEAGLIGMGTNNPLSKLEIVGEESDGTKAILNLRNDGHSMLLDGNEIDATNSDLHLQYNVANNLVAMMGGGNFGIGKSAPEEKVHLIGNFRIDGGSIMSHGGLTFKPDVDATGDDEIVFYNNVEEETLRIHTDGNVGIGVAEPTQKLEVDGTIKATSFVTSTASFPDYVFSSSYKKLSLNNLDQYIQANKHLPNMPAESEVVANGLDVADVVIKSVENIETIYLHLIEMNKKLDQLQQENAALKAQLNK